MNDISNQTCAIKKKKAYCSQTFELYIFIFIYTHRPPDGDTILIYILKIVGFKWMPVSEDDRSVIRPFKVHLHSCIMQTNP